RFGPLISIQLSLPAFAFASVCGGTHVSTTERTNNVHLHKQSPNRDGRTDSTQFSAVGLGGIPLRVCVLCSRNTVCGSRSRGARNRSDPDCDSIGRLDLLVG